MASAVARRPHPKLLSLQHVDDAFACCAGDAPMTPLAGDAPLLSATVSPRDPATKLAAVCKPQPRSNPPATFASHRLQLQSPSSPCSSSDEASDDEDDDEDVTPTASAKTVKGNTGRWTDAEHQLFLQGLETFPYRAWKKIATLIKTRTVVQIRTHAQKYYQKLEKEEARLKEREQQQEARRDDADIASPSSSASSPQKKKHLLRKRKSGAMLDMDTEEPAGLCKRVAREDHMSPKQKVAVSTAKLFFGGQFGSPESELHPRMPVAFGRHGAMTAKAAMPQQMTGQSQHQLPMDFADAAAEMILDFADEKPMTDYPFALDGGCLDQTLSSIDNDDLLQLTEEELEWFSTSSGDAAASNVKTEAIDPTPLRFQFSELDAAFNGSASPSTSVFGSELGFSDEDEDFVLDPEKFLSSYFSPSQQS
ncbi:hypothetical protein BBJ28_00005420 [Nothophytophthora sp. Chile5]|nr:hypothetical protein BBJ28_00005420 [Nothophytophthora sp. Chile5]